MHQTSSFWLASAEPAAARSSLKDELHCDVAVLGGGIAGVTTTYLLARAGADVVLLEADAIASGTTGHTTAKVSSAHGLLYARLTETHGPQTAAAYASLNEGAIDLIDEIGQRESISCSFRRRDAYIYATTDDGAQHVAAEVSAAVEAGLAAELVRSTPLPFAVRAAMRVEQQAEFHPVAWLRGLAAAAERHGARIFERSRATGVAHRPGGDSCAVETEHGRLTAKHVIVATHFPMLDRGLFFARMGAHRSYCLAAKSTRPAPEGMFLSADGPTRSLRSHPGTGGREVLIIGGEGHKVGEDDDTQARFAALEAWARDALDVTSVEHRWSAQDAMPPDGLPYVGAINPLDDRILVATGFAKWGMTNGTAAASALCDRITGTPRPQAQILDSNRFDPLAAGKDLVRHNAGVAKHLLGDRLKPAAHIEDLVPGEGAIVREGLRRRAAYRDEGGAMHLFSATCTHLGCELRFNDAERSWDCPCHGSRFDAVDGRVLEGPAVIALAPAGDGGDGGTTIVEPPPAAKTTTDRPKVKR